jgi:hypothetical protein
VRDQVSHPYKTTGKNYSSSSFVFVLIMLFCFSFQVSRHTFFERGGGCIAMDDR